MILRVAIAGAGDLAKYLVEELLTAGHSVVVISRSCKPWYERPDITFRTSDYSVSSLVAALEDCDAVVSTILDYGTGGVVPHLNILEACQQTSRCKKFIPSEYGGDTDRFPDIPLFYEASHVPVRTALAAQTDVKWTLLGNGWLMDYFVAASQRYIRDIRAYHPIDFETNKAVIAGTGDEPVCFTSVRDLSKAIAVLVAHDDWDQPTTFLMGERTSWNGIVKTLAAHGRNLEVTYRSHEQVVKESIGDSEEALVAQFGVWSSSGSCGLPEEQLERQRAKFFSAVKLRTVDEFLNDAEKDTTKQVKI
ncbi:NmrA-like protein [Grosmannia clavigera kw1407]|uniref:NmrA-like protein n=1 Tax=Grosmannia clavigera (strain kw1407 / UAMH 11150) TaxID=655863 RepID=F0XB46_GROCL|nr:NmrA-like protein [Grosmannia clavigera kw1407]EFX04964.1 NmrA-like protein [Grosmannia clavigera kw1407]